MKQIEIKTVLLLYRGILYSRIKVIYVCNRYKNSVGHDSIPVRRPDSIERTWFQIPLQSLRTFGKFDHPTLPQFTQLAIQTAVEM